MNKLTSVLAIGFVALPFLVGCGVEAPDAQVDENLTGIKLPNTTFAKYSAVFGISEGLKTPAPNKTTAVLVGGVKGDKVQAAITCFNLGDKSSVAVSLVKIASNGKSSTALSSGTLTALKDSKTFSSHVVVTGDRLAVLAKTNAALPNGVECTVSVGGLSNGVTTAFVGKMKHAYDTLTESETDTDSAEFKAFDDSKLTGLAKRQFNYLSATWSDYAPAAYQWNVDGEDVLVITEDNDGGGSRDFYTTDGRWITSGSYSESEPFSW